MHNKKQISIQLHHHVNVMQYFTLFLSDDGKQDIATNSAHIKRLISFLKNKKVLTTSLSKIWENTDVCAKQYKCASEIYLISVMSQCYSIIIYRGISAPGHGKEVVDGINATDKRYIYQLIPTVQHTGSNSQGPRFNFLGQSYL